MNNELNSFWRKYFKLDWRFGLILLLIVCGIRFLFVLKTNVENNYSAISYIMIFSALTPFIFLSKKGRKEIGLVNPRHKIELLYAFFIGVLIASALFLIGYLLYANTINNWYVYIGNSYLIPEGVAGKEKFIYFLIFATTGMIFSPIGEELFFRGIVHQSFSNSVGEQKASLIDSSAFAITHLSHFGIVYVSGVWKFLWIPSLIWMVGMFVSSLAFFHYRKRSGSIVGAILCHAGFNVGMIFYIFYCLH